MDYAAELKREIDAAQPAIGMSRECIERRIAGIAEALKRPSDDAERIALCAYRASLRKALALLPTAAA